MTNQKEVYRCQVCGNIVEVLHAGAGELTCCGQPMTLLAENSVDAATEKHDLNPGDKPEAVFYTDAADGYAREYCTLHGQWRSK